MTCQLQPRPKTFDNRNTKKHVHNKDGKGVMKILTLPSKNSLESCSGPRKAIKREKKTERPQVRKERDQDSAVDHQSKLGCFVFEKRVYVRPTAGTPETESPSPPSI
jgi:hypothetical protein